MIEALIITTMAIILQLTNVPNQHVVYLKLTKCCISDMLQFFQKSQKAKPKLIQEDKSRIWLWSGIPRHVHPAGQKVKYYTDRVAVLWDSSNVEFVRITSEPSLKLTEIHRI